jgi:hypothetical protein
MKVYISTPINARNENTFALKYEAAQKRCERIIEVLLEDERFKDAKFVHTFNLNPLGSVTETEAMGRCIQAVLESDLLYFDCRASESNGCALEYWAASIYKIPVISASLFGKLKGYDPFKPIQ